jgi:GNAT superfamily N-acetyltransferase
MRHSQVQIRHATGDDRAAVAGLASELAHSFPFCRTTFEASYATVLGSRDACLLLAVDRDDYLGYLLGVGHVVFYANGPVAHVEEVLVREDHRRHGVGRALMDAFERWAAERGCVLVALATRRALPFYLALGYEQSATYLRKVLSGPGAG